MRKDPDSVVLKINIIEEKDISNVEVSGSFEKVVHVLLLACVRVMKKYNAEKANEKTIQTLCTRFGEILFKLVKGEICEKDR